MKGFNGATDLHRWKLDIYETVVSQEEASMGPPIYIGGNAEWWHRHRSHSARFNGATDLHRWKHKWNPTSAGASTPLQWGHRFTSVETIMTLSELIAEFKASMGPPIYIGGNPIRIHVPHVEIVRFNGATDLHRWKLLPAGGSF